MGRRIVGENHRMPLLGMLEEIINSLALKQPVDEIKGGFRILNAIFEKLVISRQRVLEFGDAEITEHLHHDFWNRQLGTTGIVKNATVGNSRKHPRPGNERGMESSQ